MTFKHYELIIAAIAILIPMIYNQWRLHRARKRDFKEAMDIKIDKKEITLLLNSDRDLLTEKLKYQNQKVLTQEIRLNDHEEKNDTQFRLHSLSLESMNTDIKHLVSRVDQILIILTNK